MSNVNSSFPLPPLPNIPPPKNVVTIPLPPSPNIPPPKNVVTIPLPPLPNTPPPTIAGGRKWSTTPITQNGSPPSSLVNTIARGSKESTIQITQNGSPPSSLPLLPNIPPQGEEDTIEEGRKSSTTPITQNGSPPSSSPLLPTMPPLDDVNKIARGSKESTIQITQNVSLPSLLPLLPDIPPQGEEDTIEEGRKCSTTQTKQGDSPPSRNKPFLTKTRAVSCLLPNKATASSEFLKEGEEKNKKNRLFTFLDRLALNKNMISQIELKSINEIRKEIVSKYLKEKSENDYQDFIENFAKKILALYQTNPKVAITILNSFNFPDMTNAIQGSSELPIEDKKVLITQLLQYDKSISKTETLWRQTTTGTALWSAFIRNELGMGFEKEFKLLKERLFLERLSEPLKDEEQFKVVKILNQFLKELHQILQIFCNSHVKELLTKMEEMAPGAPLCNLFLTIINPPLITDEKVTPTAKYVANALQALANKQYTNTAFSKEGKWAYLNESQYKSELDEKFFSLKQLLIEYKNDSNVFSA